jgi:hypothetical protein
LSAGFELSQHEYCSFWQKKQSPHEIVNGTTTRWPTLSLLLPAPTSTTSPMNSCPSTSPLFMRGIT